MAMAAKRTAMVILRASMAEPYSVSLAVSPDPPRLGEARSAAGGAGPGGVGTHIGRNGRYGNFATRRRVLYRRRKDTC